MLNENETLVASLMDQIEAQRVARGYSQRELSTAAGLAPTTYWAMLKKPHAVLAANLFALMGVLKLVRPKAK